jgi:hypothetical protein
VFVDDGWYPLSGLLLLPKNVIGNIIPGEGDYKDG